MDVGNGDGGIVGNGTGVGDVVVFDDGETWRRNDVKDHQLMVKYFDEVAGDGDGDGANVDGHWMVKIRG